MRLLATFKTWVTRGTGLAAALTLSGCASLQPPGPPPTSSLASPAAGTAPTEVAAPLPAAAPVAAAATAAAPAASAPATVEATAAAPAAASAALVPLTPPEPRGRLDVDHDATRSDLWARLRSGYTMPDLNGPLVTRWETWYATRPEYVQRMTERGGRYLFHILEEIERRGMPTELALLPFIESAFNPQAVSSARAAGMWQFMPATGREFELRQNLFRDDRRAVLDSTSAALDYLQRLHVRFGDWHLALAAYNWGQGNVQRAIDRNRRAGKGTGYTDLSMPDETRNYVPKLQAVKNIVARPTSFSLVLPPLENHPFFLSVPIERDIDVALAARLAGLPLEDFQHLNPQMNKPVILAAGTPKVLLPYDNANSFLRSLAQHRGPLASWTAWVAQRNIKPGEAARIVGMPEERLREVNRIPPRMVIKRGSTLLVPRSATAEHDVSEHVADNAAIALAPEARPLRRVAFKARKGDTVQRVAQRYKVTPAQVAQWNGVSRQAKFKPGQSVVVMLAQAPRRGSKARATAAKRAPKASAAPAKRQQREAPPRRAAPR